MRGHLLGYFQRHLVARDRGDSGQPQPQTSGLLVSHLLRVSVLDLRRSSSSKQIELSAKAKSPPIPSTDLSLLPVSEADCALHLLTSANAKSPTNLPPISGHWQGCPTNSALSVCHTNSASSLRMKSRFTFLDRNFNAFPNTDIPAVRSVKSIFHHTKAAIVLVQ